MLLLFAGLAGAARAAEPTPPSPLEELAGAAARGRCRGTSLLPCGTALRNIEVWGVGGYVGYVDVGYVGNIIGAGVDVAIGVVEAAGTGSTIGILSDIFAEAFRTGTPPAIGITSPPGPSEGEATEPVEISGG